MPRQQDLFAEPDDRPAGLRYERELITPAEEAALLPHVRDLPFEAFDFHGFLGKRRTVSYGWSYEFSGTGKLRRADDIPAFVLPLRERAAQFAGMDPQSLQHVLFIEYTPGAGIGWHRDRAVFGNVIGVSLLAPCRIRFRRRIAGAPNRWERFDLFAQPRSAYLLTGAARHDWQHSIPQVDSLRYSITFRNVLEK
jgi:alkylated DNA repair dioxygenase AlkB